MMNAGRLDRRITVQVNTESIDSAGQRTLTWATHIAIWSNPVQKVGLETDEDKNRSTKRNVDFRTRWNSTITNEMRIIWEGEYYKINDIKELGRKDGLMIQTSLLSQT